MKQPNTSQEKVEYRKWYVNEKSWHQWRPLHAAAEAGYLELCKFLLECGAEIDAETVVKDTALKLGKYYSKVPIIGIYYWDLF